MAKRFCQRGTAGLAALAVGVAASSAALPAYATTMAPPMLDITHQCDVSTRHNMRAMSECVVAESEARAEILSKWEHVPDASADKCVRASKKVRKRPYVAIADCLVAEAAAPPPPAPVPVVTPIVPSPATTASAQKPSEGITSTALAKWKQFFTASPK